jgi:hypothetical protein
MKTLLKRGDRMKVKKARKRLRRVEDLLTAVIEKYRAPKSDVRNLLDTAKTAVSGAITNLPHSTNGKKPPVREAKARQEPKRTTAKAAVSGLSKAG